MNHSVPRTGADAGRHSPTGADAGRSQTGVRAARPAQPARKPAAPASPSSHASLQTVQTAHAAHAAPAAPSAAHPHSTPAFAGLGLLPALVLAVAAEGYVTPTPVQSRAIPHVLEGRDLLGCAQTGTGKTAAFVLPMLQRLAAKPRTGRIRALVLAPTRELAAQIGERTGAYGKNLGLRHTVVYGGVGQRPQEDALRAKPDILIATPGRLLDLMEQGFVKLDAVEIFVLDEADRMLDMGFIHDVRRVIRVVPTKRQTLLFSATMPPVIAELSRSILIDPIRVDVVPQATTADRIDQVVYHVPKRDKRALLEHVLLAPGVIRTIVFTRTKHGANKLVEQLDRSGIRAAAIHGNKSQGARERALEGFRSGSIPVLVATDLAARGIDVDGISHVVNYDLPNVPEQYVHRIGRTARAGADGRAIAFCDEEEKGLLRDIEKLIRQRIVVVDGSQAVAASAKVAPRPVSVALGDDRAGAEPERQRTSSESPSTSQENRPPRAWRRRRYRGPRFPRA